MIFHLRRSSSVPNIMSAPSSCQGALTVPVPLRNVKCIITGNVRDTIFWKSEDHLGRSRSNKSQLQLRGSFLVDLTLTHQAKMKTESHRLTSSCGQEACCHVRIKDGFLQSPTLLTIHCSFQTHNPFGMTEQDDQQMLRIIILSEVALDHFFKSHILSNLLFI